MLLNIYLGTTAISWATTFIFSVACVKKFKREGYKFVKENKSLPEKVMTFISAAFILSIPVYNILNTIVILWTVDESYGHLEDEYLKQGKIYKPIAEELNNDYESKILNEEKADTYTASVQKTRTEKTYDEMTTEEKLAYLQQEKEKLINQATPQVENPFTLNKRK